MHELPEKLYRAEQVRQLDATAIERFGLPGAVLMERAGRAAFEALRERWPKARRIAVLCGTGNNGGDGYVLARLAHRAGLGVDVFQVGDPARVRGDALSAAQALVAEGVVAAHIMPERLAGYDVLVDALLGTGLQGEVQGPWRGAIEQINAAGTAVLAIDIPSGLHADTGAVLGAAVRADVTVSFIGLKQGLFTADGPQHGGAIRFADLQVPAEVYAGVTSPARRIGYAALCAMLAPRPRNAHKGMFGHVLVIGGEQGMAGAVRLAAEAAARSGAGLVSVATRAAHAALISAVRPELMCHGIEQPGQLAPLLARASVIAVGPGLGQGAWGQALWAQLRDCALPMLVDADALNLLAQAPQRRDDWILTPHPGEAARLLGMSAAQVQQDRFAAAAELQARYGGVIVLKGAGTLVAGPSGPIGVCVDGNPGMASGGMGDVLSGIIAGLRAQGWDNATAARLGVCLHGAAADRAARDGERGLLAGDLLGCLRPLLNPPH